MHEKSKKVLLSFFMIHVTSNALPAPDVIRMLPSPMQPTPSTRDKTFARRRQRSCFFLFALSLSCKPIHTPPLSTLYSSIVLTQFHSPFKFSFHRLTLLSPPLTANTFPLRLQLTLHSTASKSKTVGFHSLGCAGSLVHIRTVLSCAAEAM